MRSILFLATLLVIVIGSLTVINQKKAQQNSDGTPGIGGHFTLIDQNNKTVKDTDFDGRYRLIFFGFTNCPDMCPIGLTTITQVMKDLGKQSKEVVPVLITVDPQRDTPKQMKKYARSFDMPLVALTGKEEDLVAVQKLYGVYASRSTAAAPKNKNDGHAHGNHDAAATAEYQVDHTGYIYLMNRKGEYTAHFPYDAAATTITERVRRELAAKP